MGDRWERHVHWLKAIYGIIVQLAPGYVCVSECECESNSVKVTQSNSTWSSNDRSGGAMEEAIETAKSEFRLVIKCIVRRVFIYS